MVGIIFNIVALSKQGVTLKNIGNMPNGWIGETLSKQGVALKNARYTVIVGIVHLFKCVYSKLVQGARIEFGYMKSVLIEIER